MDRTKAIIEFIKTLFLVSVAALFSMIGYLFINFNNLSLVKIYLIFYGILNLIISIIIFIMLWIKFIKKLKD